MPTTKSLAKDVNNLAAANKANNHVIIVGAGWSGLACAIELVSAGYPVTILESAPQAGGRARTIKPKNSGLTIDNGQHIMLGAYHFTREIFKTLGLCEADIFEKIRLELNMFSSEQIRCQLKSPLLPAPLHLLYALLNLQGLTFYERFIAMRMSIKLKLCHYRLEQDISVEKLLRQYHQPKKVIKSLWEPLCLATMSTPIHYASGQIFLNILKDSFSKKRQDSDLLFFKQDLSQVFCLPALQYIRDHGGSIIYSSKVSQINHCTDKVEPVNFAVTSKNIQYQSQHLVLACPAYISEKLLNTFPHHIDLMPATASLKYSYEPIYTIYIQYAHNIRLPHRMCGFFSLQQDIISQWVIDRSLTRQDGLFAFVISGPGEHTRLTSAQLVERVHAELKFIITDLPDFLHYRIIKEKRATFSCHVNIEQQRPKNQTSISGLLLAGDYTSTGYPSTLEGAIKSGVSAARQIMQLK